MDALEENRIISDILGGDANAYALLVRSYERAIYNLMVRMTSDTHEALDLSQEAFIKAYNKLESFKQGSRFFPWLYAIAMNVARDWLRQQKKPTVSAEDIADYRSELAVDAEQEETLLLHLDVEQVNEALLKLTPETREALILRFREECSLKEVAVALDISLSGAKMRVHRGLERLRTLLTSG